jgi:hypothetical protein
MSETRKNVRLLLSRKLCFTRLKGRSSDLLTFGGLPILLLDYLKDSGAGITKSCSMSLQQRVLFRIYT